MHSILCLKASLDFISWEIKQEFRVDEAIELFPSLKNNNLNNSDSVQPSTSMGNSNASSRGRGAARARGRDRGKGRPLKRI